MGDARSPKASAAAKNARSRSEASRTTSAATAVATTTARSRATPSVVPSRSAAATTECERTAKAVVLRDPLEADQRPAAEDRAGGAGGRDSRLPEAPGRDEPEQERPCEQLERDHDPDGRRTPPRAPVA